MMRWVTLYLVLQASGTISQKTHELENDILLYPHIPLPMSRRLMDTELDRFPNHEHADCSYSNNIPSNPDEAFKAGLDKTFKAKPNIEDIEASYNLKAESEIKGINKAKISKRGINADDSYINDMTTNFMNDNNAIEFQNGRRHFHKIPRKLNLLLSKYRGQGNNKHLSNNIPSTNYKWNANDQWNLDDDWNTNNKWSTNDRLKVNEGIYVTERPPPVQNPTNVWENGSDQWSVDDETKEFNTDDQKNTNDGYNKWTGNMDDIYVTEKPVLVQTYQSDWLNDGLTNISSMSKPIVTAALKHVDGDINRVKEALKYNGTESMTNPIQDIISMGKPIVTAALSHVNNDTKKIKGAVDALQPDKNKSEDISNSEVINIREVREKLLDHLLDYINTVVKDEHDVKSREESMDIKEKLKNYYDPHHFEEVVDESVSSESSNNNVNEAKLTKYEKVNENSITISSTTNATEIHDNNNTNLSNSGKTEDVEIVNSDNENVTEANSELNEQEKVNVDDINGSSSDANQVVSGTENTDQQFETKKILNSEEINESVNKTDPEINVTQYKKESYSELFLVSRINETKDILMNDVAANETNPEINDSKKVNDTSNKSHESIEIEISVEETNGEDNIYKETNDNWNQNINLYENRDKIKSSVNETIKATKETPHSNEINNTTNGTDLKTDNTKYPNVNDTIDKSHESIEIEISIESEEEASNEDNVDEEANNQWKKQKNHHHIAKVTSRKNNRRGTIKTVNRNQNVHDRTQKHKNPGTRRQDHVKTKQVKILRQKLLNTGDNYKKLKLSQKDIRGSHGHNTNNHGTRRKVHIKTKQANIAQQKIIDIKDDENVKLSQNYIIDSDGDNNNKLQQNNDRTKINRPHAHSSNGGKNIRIHYNIPKSKHINNNNAESEKFNDKSCVETSKEIEVNDDYVDYDDDNDSQNYHDNFDHTRLTEEHQDSLLHETAARRMQSPTQKECIEICRKAWKLVENTGPTRRNARDDDIPHVVREKKTDDNKKEQENTENVKGVQENLDNINVVQEITNNNIKETQEMTNNIKEVQENTDHITKVNEKTDNTKEVAKKFNINGAELRNKVTFHLDFNVE